MAEPCVNCRQLERALDASEMRHVVRDSSDAVVIRLQTQYFDEIRKLEAEMLRRHEEQGLEISAVSDVQTTRLWNLVKVLLGAAAGGGGTWFMKAGG